MRTWATQRDSAFYTEVGNVSESQVYLRESVKGGIGLTFSFVTETGHSDDAFHLGQEKQLCHPRVLTCSSVTAPEHLATSFIFGSTYNKDSLQNGCILHGHIETWIRV
jgi:hypothetical protein